MRIYKMSKGFNNLSLINYENDCKISRKIKNPLRKLSGKIAMKKNVIFTSHHKSNTLK